MTCCNGEANGDREICDSKGLRSIKHLTEKSNKSRRVTGSRRTDRYDRISEEEARSTGEERRRYTRRRGARIHHGVRGFWGAGAPVRNLGVETRGIFMATAAAPIFILFRTRNRACGELAWNPKNIPPLFRFITGLSGLSPPPRLSIRPFLFGKPRTSSLSRVFARFHMRFLLARGGAKRRSFSYREKEDPFYFRVEIPPRSLWTSPAKHANARWHDEILNDSGIPDFNKGNGSTHVWLPLRSFFFFFFCLPSKFTSRCKKYDL